ncbi:hypothetical protein ACFX11_004167 [Malus domestica]
MAQNVSKESFDLLLVLVWSIWKVRNEFIWNGVEGSIGGCGLVVRSSEGRFLAAQVSIVVAVRSDLHVKAAAARAAALLLRRWVTEQVHVEGDALLVISAIQNAGATFSGHYRYMFEDTRQLLRDFKQWKITFGRRKTNKVAHRLARFSLIVDHPVSWFEKPPDVISHLLLEDSTSS